MFKSLKVRFIAVFTLFIIVLCVVISAFAVREAHSVAKGIFSGQGLSVVRQTAQLIDAEQFVRLSRSLDASDPWYERTRLQMLELKMLTGCKYLYTMAPKSGDTFIYIIDGSANPNQEGFSPLGSEEDVSGYDAAFKRALTEKTPQVSALTLQEGWGWIISVYTPILDKSGNAAGIVGCDFDAKPLHDTINAQIFKFALIAVFFFVAGFAALIFMMRMIFSRIAVISSLLREVSEGEGDLTKRITIRRRDEIGNLASYFNLTMDKISNLVVTIKDKTAALETTGNDLVSRMAQTAGAAGQITQNIQTIQSQMINESATVNRTSSTMERVTDNVEKLGSNIEEQTRTVAMSASAIEEMLASVRNVTRTLIENSDNVRELTAASEAGRADMEEVSRNVSDIASESEGLLEINAVIESISVQTNLLAMNASIEAAHAGETGKGFAVVAGEIRKLSSNSSSQSKNISETLKKIKGIIDAVTRSTNTVLEKFRAIDALVKTVSDQENSIRNAMEEQGAGSRQILEAVEKLKEITGRVQRGSSDMMTGAKEVIQESRRLEQVTRQMSGGMDGMTAHAEQITEAVTMVNKISNENKEHIGTLASEIARFKVEN